MFLKKHLLLESIRGPRQAILLHYKLAMVFAACGTRQVTSRTQVYILRGNIHEERADSYKWRNFEADNIHDGIGWGAALYFRAGVNYGNYKGKVQFAI